MAMHLTEIDIARLLISHPTSLDHHDRLGNSVAHSIFWRGFTVQANRDSDESLLKILLSVGYSDFRLLNALGASALSFAVRCCNPSIVDLLLRQGSQISSTTSNKVALGGRLNSVPLPKECL